VAGELPEFLRQADVDVDVLTPAYGTRLESEVSETFAISFNGREETLGIVVKDSNDVPVRLLTNRTYFGTDYSAPGHGVPPLHDPDLFRHDYTRPYVDSVRVPFYDDALRFSFFSEACLELVRRQNPDIVHINDWPLGYLFGRMVVERLPQRRILTIHNIGYQGNVGKDRISGWMIDELARHPEVGPSFEDPHPLWNSVNPLRLAMEAAHMVNTVSPTYAREMTQPEDATRYFEGGKGLEPVAARLDREGRLLGILNGFRYSFEPTDDRFAEILAKKAAARLALCRDFQHPDWTLLGFVGRAVEQKFKLLTEHIDGKSVLEHILELDGVNVAVLATGLPEFERFIRRFEGRPNYSATVAFDRKKAEQISLGSDVFLMPSLFEPCGIAQMESLSCATPPLVRWTGGLVDTVIPHTSADGTGFGFDGTSSRDVLQGLLTAVRDSVQMKNSNNDRFRDLQRRGFRSRFLWSTAAARYVERLYTPVVSKN
jgi:starch synthase